MSRIEGSSATDLLTDLTDVTDRGNREFTAWISAIKNVLTMMAVAIKLRLEST
ncbi:hypothetical protein QUB68_22155 [Microcoleus sp. A006_D1]|uniref:hypothetical protein n=1 Tax=Microcoleus sp. A006_D1 TaxID=3055267 RepID=UPI002FD5BE8A